jgi:hypothetical protein
MAHTLDEPGWRDVQNLRGYAVDWPCSWRRSAKASWASSWKFGSFCLRPSVEARGARLGRPVLLVLAVSTLAVIALIYSGSFG